jgi:glycosyltransferase involved in cell wall biosynthesis
VARLAARAPLTRALARARSEVEGLSVTVDGRALTDTMAGTQVHTLELIAALHRTGGARLRVVVPPDLGVTARELLGSLAGVELLDATDVDRGTARTSVVHRPYQVSAPVDLLVLRLLGERIVVTQQDLLNHHDPAYHRDREGWQAHRRLTRESLAVADAVVTFSEHVARGLAAEELAPDDRRRVIPIGVDHSLPALAAEPRAPADAGAIAERPFLLCLGSDLHHKNRVFALGMLEALRERHGWDGVLVLAGPQARWGSSREAEHAFLASRPGLAEAVVPLPEVDEAGKAWLYANAAAALYPTTSEGFGLVPFEAATAGTPCLFASGSALAELLPAELGLLVPWNAERSAERAWTLLGDGVAADAWVRRARDIAAGLTWDRTAAALLELYADVIASPPREQAALAWTAMAAEDRRGHFEGLYWQLSDEIGPTGHSLVGKDRLLDEDAQRAIAALARRRATRGAFLGALRLLHRLAGRPTDGR